MPRAPSIRERETELSDDHCSHVCRQGVSQPYGVTQEASSASRILDITARHAAHGESRIALAAMPVVPHDKQIEQAEAAEVWRFFKLEYFRD